MARSRRFGAFGGVFTPSILTILGVIMYMRLPMIIGQAGLYATLGIIVVAHIISISTGLSVSSIATDKKVKAGGTYYIISRSLGLPIGGTLGLALFVGLSFSVSLYLIGFAESFLGFWGFPINIENIRIAGSIILLTVTIITFISTSLAVKTQYLIMAAIFISLLSIFFGKHDYTPIEPHFFSSDSTVPLMVLFGIFFPAVTGFEAGVSMSGDLKDPKKAIPRGTILAIGIGLVVYIILAFFLSYTVDADLLANDPNVLLNISLVPQLVIAGIWGATLSSALGSILAAPRILQATAIDKITPKFFAHGTKLTNEPRNALLLTFLIAECGILIGQLDVIARIVSIFFITTYGFLNLSSAFEAKTSADFRPGFKVPYWVGLIGALACTLVMIQLDLLAMVGAIIILGLVYLYIKRKELKLESGDAWSSVWASAVKKGLRHLSISSLHSRNWRPNIILFSGDMSARPHLIKIGTDLAGKLGMITGFELEPSNEPVLIKNIRTLDLSKKPSELIIHTHQCRDLFSGIDEIVRTYGFTGVEPNTILLGWSRKEDKKDSFTKTIHSFQRNNYNSIFLSYHPERQFGNHKTIDIWWGGWGTNLVFSIYLIRHLTSAGEWKDSNVRLLIINNDNTAAEKIHKTISGVLDHHRVDLKVKIINNSVDGYERDDIISRESAQTDLTIFGFPWEVNQKTEMLYDNINSLSNLIGTSLFVNASDSFEEVNLDFEKTKPAKTILPKNEELSVIPELYLSKYQEINENLNKIDSNGQKILDLFNEKAFVPYFTENKQFLSEITSITQTTFNTLNKIPDVPDQHKRQKAIKTAKSDFNYHINQAIEKYINEKLQIQIESLNAGIEWYVKKLEDDIFKFPQRLSVSFNKEDFKIKKNDSLGLKMTKLRKRITHPFSRKSIVSSIRFRELAEYYLRDNRYQFLSALLKKFENDTITNIAKLRPLFTGMDDLIIKYEKLLQSKDFRDDQFEKEKNDLKEKMDQIVQEIKYLQNLYRHRLKAEFRKNLMVMAHDMEKVNINGLIIKKRRSRRYYKSLKLQNINFPEDFLTNSSNFINKIYLDLMLQLYKHRMEDKLEKFLLNASQNIESGLVRKLKTIQNNTLDIPQNPKLISGLKLDISALEESIHLENDFDNLSNDIELLVESLPEVMVIGSTLSGEESSRKNNEEETLTIPLRKIALHFIETRFLDATFEFLEKESVTIKKSIFLIKDQLSLSRFNLENIEKSNPEYQVLMDEILKQTRSKLKKEEEKIWLINKNLRHQIQVYIDLAYEPLLSYRIGESMHEFSGYVRDYKSRRIRNRFEAKRQQIVSFVRTKSARLLYSKSEGILLARQLMENKNLQSVNEKILDFVEKVSPKQKVLDDLPHYYKNLFSGRSSISEDFWVFRKADEAQFSKAVKRYKAGYLGGILVLGERNSGKTAFCRYVAKHHFAEEKVYHIFPLQKGSISTEEFAEEIRKVTGLNGDPDEIFETLPHASTIFIHDLELWWERSPDGYNVVIKLLQLMNDFSDKCLFVINMNPFAYKIINNVHKIEENFISIITNMPFDSEEIKEMIIRRHHSSGLKFRYNNRDEENISEFRMAGLFSKYFDISKGNPGVALNQWLTNINKFSGEVIHINHPKNNEPEILENLDDDWRVILIQIIIHKRLLIEKLAKVLNQNQLDLEETIAAIKRTGLIEERSSRVYMINIYAEPYLIRTFIQQGLL